MWSSNPYRFPFPSVPRFAPDPGPYAQVDWRWWARNLLDEPSATVLLDVETTGVYFTDAIVELAIIDLAGTVVLDTLVDPQMPIPGQATAIHGITDEMVAGYPRFADLLEDLRPTLTTKGILAFNIQFDIRMIQSALHHLGEPHWIPSSHGCVQRAFVAYRERRPVRVPGISGQSLLDACRAMGITTPQTHRALDDCQLTLALLRAMAD